MKRKKKTQTSKAGKPETFKPHRKVGEEGWNKEKAIHVVKKGKGKRGGGGKQGDCREGRVKVGTKLY